MAVAQRSRSAAIHDRLGHPVIDGDGHVLGFVPEALDYVRDIGGPKVLDRFLALTFGDERMPVNGAWYAMSPAERRRRRAVRPAWWTLPTRSPLDQGTAILPALLYERLDEIGLDFTVLYASIGLICPHIGDEEVRRATCRAFNTYLAEVFGPYADRMTPVAAIPMHTPEEAIEELDHAVGVLGLKAVQIAGFVERPILAAAERDPELARYATWLDTFGIDSEHDYDPVWRKCVELKVSPTAHSWGMGWGSRRSISNYMYNHNGHFGAAHEALAKALFFGGVTRRFPRLRLGFQEGGVAWAANLYATIVGEWEKRNPRAIQNYNPANTDAEALLELFVRYGGEGVRARLAQDGPASVLGPLRPREEDPAALDDWAACGIERREDIRDLFAPNFYFGCEADDPLVAIAFDDRINPLGARLNVTLSSDIGHWDVPDMTEVLAEAYEQVESGRLTEADFRDFVFANPARLFAGTNPEFFAGTAVEADVAKLLGREPSAGRGGAHARS